MQGQTLKSQVQSQSAARAGARQIRENALDTLATVTPLTPALRGEGCDEPEMIDDLCALFESVPSRPPPTQTLVANRRPICHSVSGAMASASSKTQRAFTWALCP